ncbi:MAG: DUF3027 domain-containing protein [Bifidobacterium sp.]|jgi:hypothetical protein|nr:DUF3027 domain-containing protein [Bifidobacterium sp.]MCH4208657.1 DUF3027 domain-containing protein [Bifidobacterium sp.]MCI1224371.1 DUF3027 domain-containing protein [Bifidobacterium sp.]
MALSQSTHGESPSGQSASGDPLLEASDLARQAASETAEDPSLVGGFVQSIELGGDVTDFRFVALNRGYEGWQWSVTLYHDAELGRWTVNEATLIPTDSALRPPQWVPWKDRLTAADLSVTDSIGTDPNDPRLEDGFRKTESTRDDSADSAGTPESAAAMDSVSTAPAHESPAGEFGDDHADNAGADGQTGGAGQDQARLTASQQDVDDAVEEFDLSRRHVMSLLGRSQTAKRWYEGQHGPKSLSTKTAAGEVCSTCGFFIPLKGDLNVLFGVCANKWSPDDGRVVSIDHGCGEHSEIDPPEPSRLWVQPETAFDDLHIDVLAQTPREERSEIELIEKLAAEDGTETEGAPDGAEANAPADAAQAKTGANDGKADGSSRNGDDKNKNDKA